MAIPGLKASHPVRAKVRVGEKRKTQGGKEYPASVDYFVCDDEDFRRVVGEKKNELMVYLPFARAEDNFSTGLEWWRGKQLTCYSKGEGSPPLAYRVKDMVGEAEVRGEPMGRDRIPITCPVRECEFIKNKSCKPMGRLQFWIDGIDRRGGVFQLDTHSWNAIEKIEAVLSLVGDPRDVPLTLRVEMWQRGTSKFPVVSVEVPMQVNTAQDVELADALVLLRKEVDAIGDGIGALVTVKARLCEALDLSNPGWREKQAFIDRIKEVGVVEAARKMLERYEL